MRRRGKLFHDSAGCTSTRAAFPQTCDDAIETLGHRCSCSRIIEETADRLGYCGRSGLVLNEFGHNQADWRERSACQDI